MPLPAPLRVNRCIEGIPTQRAPHAADTSYPQHLLAAGISYADERLGGAGLSRLVRPCTSVRLRPVSRTGGALDAQLLHRIVERWTRDRRSAAACGSAAQWPHRLVPAGSCPGRSTCDRQRCILYDQKTAAKRNVKGVFSLQTRGWCRASRRVTPVVVWPPGATPRAGAAARSQRQGLGVKKSYKTTC